MTSSYAANASVPAVINFHNQKIITFEKSGIIYVALKPVCEQMGLSWEPQRKLIARDLVLKQVASIMEVTSKGRDGKTYNAEMVCLPLQYLNGWLFKINAARYKNSQRRELIVRYQKECYQVLYDYWHKSAAAKPPQGLAESSAGTLLEKAFRLIEHCQNELAFLRRERERARQPGFIGSPVNPLVVEYGGEFGEDVRCVYMGRHVRLVGKRR